MSGKPEIAMPPLARFQVDALDVRVYPDRKSLGLAAAIDVAAGFVEKQRPGERTRVIFAAAPSQNEFLDGLVENRDVDWSLVDLFHMDEYLGILDSHPASFRHYLTIHLVSRVPIPSQAIHWIAGEQVGESARIARDYAAELARKPIDLVCAGIGENGHLAFNDPSNADFEDPEPVKMVRLDHDCRVQQVNDGCFPTIEQVPTHAFTLSIPTLMNAAKLSVVVPGERKADAIYAALRGPIADSLPASVLRTHPNARLYLDADSARRIL